MGHRELFFRGQGLSMAELGQLEAALDPTEAKKLVAGFMGISGFDNDPKRESIFVDFHYYNYAFCKELGLNMDATSVFMKIMDEVWKADFNPKPGVVPDMSTSFDRFVEWILKHSVEDPPRRICVFNKSSVAPLIEYATNSYFRQFRLYQYIFNSVERVEIEQTEV